MATAPTFDQLDREAGELGFNTELGAGVNYLIAHADGNAADEAGKMASLESLLAYAAPEQASAVEWFVARGVRF